MSYYLVYNQFYCSKMTEPVSLCSLLIFSSTFSLIFAAVTLTTDGLNVTVDNGKVKIIFNSDATVSSVNVDGQNIASTKARSFYLDWNSNGQAYFTPDELIVVENTAIRAHFYWLQESKPGVFRIELHYVMENDVSGIFSWAKYTNDQSSYVTVGDTRTVYRFNPSILTRGTNMVRDDELYLYSYLHNQTHIQDETWLLPDGTYYTKYDFAGYFRETSYQGVYGNGYGAFLISASREYHAGGPLRQDLLVHQDSLIINIFVGSHLGTSGLSAPPDWTHIYGPWLMYFNTGNDSYILADVESRAKLEQETWPYLFVEDDDYPVLRGAAYGYIRGQKRAAVLLYDSTSEGFETQALGYLYSAETDSEGYFEMKNIHPGDYKFAAYPLLGNGTDNIATTLVSIAEENDTYIGTFYFPEPENMIWSLGEANRRSNEFRYSGELRNYVWSTLPPATLTFTIGESDPSNDWYYAQTKPGNWTIRYTDTNDGNSRILRVALAAASLNPLLTVFCNGHQILTMVCGNDHAIYRSAMQSGSFYSVVLPIPSEHVVNGTNNVMLELTKGEVMYDAINLQKNIV